MEFQVIKSPSPGALEIIFNRSNVKLDKKIVCTDAVGLVQGRMIDMVIAADIAYKIVDVVVCDVRGSCPQNMVLLAIFGDTASVESAIVTIRENMEIKKC
jgi:hypothetical protein